MNNYNPQTKNNGDIYKIMDDFLYVFLPAQKGASKHTIRSYKNSLDSLLMYVAKTKKVKVSKLTFGDFDGKIVASYLDSLTADGKMDSTRNQRRASICSFFSYAAAMHPTLEYKSMQMHKVPIKRAQRTVEEVLTIEEINLLLKQIENNHVVRLKYRDKAIVFMLYDTAARINELLGIRLKDLVLNRRDPYIILHGKGKKVRRVNLSPETITVLKDYATVYDVNLNSCSDEPLFFCPHYDGLRFPLHSDTIRRMLKRYEKEMKKEMPSFSKSLHPHLLRATRATHLLSDGVNVYFISKFLGHADISTTEKYLRIDLGQINEALRRAAQDKNNPLKDYLNPERSMRKNYA